MAWKQRVNWVWMENSKRDFSHSRGILSKLPSVQGTMLLLIEWLECENNNCLESDKIGINQTLFSTPEEKLSSQFAKYILGTISLCLCPSVHLHDGLCLFSCVCRPVYSWCHAAACLLVLHCCHLKTGFEFTIICSAIQQHTVHHLLNTHTTVNMSVFIYIVTIHTRSCCKALYKQMFPSYSTESLTLFLHYGLQL